MVALSLFRVRQEGGALLLNQRRTLVMYFATQCGNFQSIFSSASFGDFAWLYSWHTFNFLAQTCVVFLDDLMNTWGNLSFYQSISMCKS